MNDDDIQLQPEPEEPADLEVPVQPVARVQPAAPIQPAAAPAEPPAMPAQPTVPTQPAATPAPSPRPLTRSQKAIRTYESDVAEVLANKKASTASIAIAETRRATGEDSIGSSDETSHAGRKALIVLLSLILIFAGLVGAYYLYSVSPLAPTVKVAPQAQAPAPLVPADAQVALPIDGLTPLAALALVRAEIAKPQAADTIKEIIPVETTGGQRFPVTAPDMASAMDIGAPDTVIRSLADDWMLGVYADQSGQKTVFVVATIDYFQNAFAGMLQWESVMADDLKQYLYQNSPADITTAGVAAAASSSPSITGLSASTTATASSTKPISTSTPAYEPYVPPNQPVILHGSFVDRIIDNKDVREFTTSDGTVLFLYSFIDNTHLVVTGSEATLSEILKRLEQQAFVR